MLTYRIGFYTKTELIGVMKMLAGSSAFGSEDSNGNILTVAEEV